MRELCRGTGHQIDKCAWPADANGLPAKAVITTVEDLEDEAVETTAVWRCSSQSPAIGVLSWAPPAYVTSGEV